MPPSSIITFLNGVKTALRKMFEPDDPGSNIRERFPNAHQFFEGCFHMDWGCDSLTPDEVVAQDIKGTGKQMRVETLRELRQMSSEFDDDQLSDAIVLFDCCFDPERFWGISTRQWVDEIIVAFEESLKSDPPEADDSR